MAESNIFGSQLFRRAQAVQKEFPQKPDQVHHGSGSSSNSATSPKKPRIRFSEGTGSWTRFPALNDLQEAGMTAQRPNFSR